MSDYAHAPNLTNKVFGFTVETVENADSSDALYAADVQESDADPVKGKNSVRIGSARSRPELAGENLAKEFDGRLAVEFMARPASTSLADRVEARETAHQMAMEFITAVGLDRSLGGRGCFCSFDGKEDGYRNIKGDRYQISVVALINDPE